MADVGIEKVFDGLKTNEVRAVGQAKAKTIEMPTENQEAGNNLEKAFETMFQKFNRDYNRAERYNKIATDLAVVRDMVLEGRTEVAVKRLYEIIDLIMDESQKLLKENVNMICEFKEKYIGAE